MRILILAVRSLAVYFPLSVLYQFSRLGNLLTAKAAFEFRLALVSQLRAKSLRKDLIGPLDVSTTLFRSDEYAMDLPDHGWNRLCDQLVVVPIHGGHVSMNSEELCAKLIQAVAGLSGSRNEAAVIHRGSITAHGGDQGEEPSKRLQN